MSDHPDSTSSDTSAFIPPVTEPAGEEPAQEKGILVTLPLFEGPLDLLLHLIRTNEMDIFDIPIVEIARQYDEYIGLMNEMNLDLAGEFLVMAATLAYIKSRMLLPQEPLADGEEREDPRAELTRQLVEHQKYRLAAENLQALDSVRGMIWSRPPRRFPEFEGESQLVVDLQALMEAFRRVLAQAAAEERLRAPSRRYSVAEKIAWLRSRLETSGSLPFLDLLAGLGSRSEMIAAFLALLELIRLQEAVAHQRSVLGEIWISRGASSPGRQEGR